MKTSPHFSENFPHPRRLGKSKLRDSGHMVQILWQMVEIAPLLVSTADAKGQVAQNRKVSFWQSAAAGFSKFSPIAAKLIFWPESFLSVLRPLCHICCTRVNKT